MIFSKDKLRDMIPDYLNHTLPEQERIEFESCLSSYPDVEREVREFSKIKASYGSVREDLPNASDEVFRKVMNGIKGEQKSPAAAMEPGFFGRLRDFFCPLFASPRISWAVVGAQMVVILLLVTSTPQPDKYSTLSSGPPGTVRGKTINIVFDSNVKEMDIRNILNSIEGRIIDGPSSQGLYTILIKENRNMTRTLEDLKKHQAVRFAEKGFNHTPE